MADKHFITIGLVFSLLVSGSLQAGEVLLIPKLGIHKQDTSEITIGSNVITLKDNGDSGVIGFEGGYLFDMGLALTGEVLLYQHDVSNETGGPLRGEVNVGAFTANATYHFNHGSTFQPLLGAGIGSQVASIDNSNTNRDLVGYRIQGKIGFLVKLNDTIGMTAEYKRVYFSMEDEDDSSIEFKSQADFIGLGLTIHL